jgi:hypothetical protein
MTVYVVVAVEVENAYVVGVFASLASARGYIETHYPGGAWQEHNLNLWDPGPSSKSTMLEGLEIEAHVLQGEASE